MTETYGSDPKIWKQEGTLVQNRVLSVFTLSVDHSVTYEEEFPSLLAFR